MAATVRVLTLLAAVAAGVLVAQPSTGFDWPAYRGGWAIGPTLFTANLTAVLALLMAALISIRPNVASGARALAGALACGSAAWGLYSGDFTALSTLEEALLAVGKPLLLVSTSGFMVAFITRFPRAVSPVEIVQVLPDPMALATPGDPWHHIGAPLERLSHALILRPVLAVLRLFGVAPAHGSSASRRSVDPPRPWIATVQIAVWRTIVNPGPVFALLAAVAIVATLRGWSGATIAVNAAAVYIVVLSAIAMRVSYRNANSDERRRMLWMMVGFAGGSMIVLATMLASFVIVIVAGATDTSLLLAVAAPGGPGIWYLSWAAAVLFVVVCLAVAVFRHGALDPGLALRRTVAASIVGVLMAALLAAIETFVSEVLTDRLALPASTGAIASGVIAALVFGPVWKRITEWVDRSVLRPPARTDDPAGARPS